MSPTEIAPAIQQKYEEHSALVVELARTEYVSTTLRENEKDIARMEKELEQKRETLKVLEKQTESEKRDVEKLKSMRKRVALVLKSGFEGKEKKLAKEDQEWAEAMEKEKDQKVAIATLEAELNNAKLSNIDLKAKADRRTKARLRLNELYTELFEGHTDDYPEEDQAEEAVKKAEAKHQKDQERLAKVTKIHSWLHKADKAMRTVLERMNKAEDFAVKEVAKAGNFDVTEIKDLKSAKKHAVEVETYLSEARKLDHSIPSFEPIHIPFQDIGHQPQFGSEKGDILIHRVIRDAAQECIRYHTKLQAEDAKASSEAKLATKAAVNTGMELARKRAKLEEVRRKIIENVHKGILPQKSPWVPTQGIPESHGPTPGGFAVPSPHSATDSPVSSNLPAGGFRSTHGSIEIASPGPNDAPNFPDSPEFRYPISQFGTTEPGFRGTAEMNAIASIAAVSMPSVSPWAINREAAEMLLNAAQEPIEGEGDDKDITMPQAPESPKMPGGLANFPATPAEPGFPTSPADAAFSGYQAKAGEDIAYDGPRVKLFQFDSSIMPPKWDEVGIGRLRMVADKESKTVRLVVSRVPGAAPLLDRPIRSGARLLPHPSSDKSFMWTLETEPKGPFAMRMSSPEAAREVYSAFERVQHIFPAPTPSGSSDSWPSMPAAPGDEPPLIPGQPAGMPTASPATSPAPSMPFAPSMPSAPADNDKPLPMPGSMPTGPSEVKEPSVAPVAMPTSPADGKQSADALAGKVAGLNIGGTQTPPAGSK